MINWHRIAARKREILAAPAAQQPIFTSAAGKYSNTAVKKDPGTATTYADSWRSADRSIPRTTLVRQSEQLNKGNMRKGRFSPFFGHGRIATIFDGRRTIL